MLRRFILLGGVVSSMGLCGMAWAAQAEYPCPTAPCPAPNVCVPNVPNFGYFQTKWRTWPGEHRMEIDNPRGYKNEVLPTPVGQEQMPAPPAATPQQETAPPPGMPQGELLPPTGAILPPESQAPMKQVIPGTKPAKPKVNEPLLPPSGGVPGLPTESAAPSMPGLPVTEPPKNEPPKSEPPKTDLPITEPPKSEPPKVEAPKSEPPKVEAPKSEPPKVEAPKSEPPKVEPPKSEPPKESPKKDEAKPAGTAHESVQPPTAAAAQFEELGTPRNRNAVVMTADSQEAVQGRAEHGAHRAESINSMAPGLPTRSVQRTAFNVVEPSTPVVNASVKGGEPPALAIAGYCPVELVRNGRWVQGDARFTVVYRGCAYRMASAAQLQQFKANPESFAPVDSGNDVVLSLDEHKTVSGTVAYCATYNGRLYMFSSPATQARFNQNPLRYAVKK